MRAVQILVSAVTLGLVAGYAWSAMPHAPARGVALAAPPKSTIVALPPSPEEQPTEQEKEWASRAHDEPRPMANSEAVEQSVYYARCKEAWAAGAAPIYAGQPGYRSGLDGDSDGIACEPYRG